MCALGVYGSGGGSISAVSDFTSDRNVKWNRVSHLLLSCGNRRDSVENSILYK